MLFFHFFHLEDQTMERYCETHSSEGCLSIYGDILLKLKYDCWTDKSVVGQFVSCWLGLCSCGDEGKEAIYP